MNRKTRRLLVLLVIVAPACGQPAPPRTSGTDTSAEVTDPGAAPAVADRAPAVDAAALPTRPAPDAADVRPPDVVVAPPPGFVESPAADAPAPAPHGWWKKKHGCGKGRRMERIDLREHVRSRRDPTLAYVCRDAAGRADGPHVSLYADGQVHEEGTARRDANHGTRRAYDPDGRLWLETPFVNDLREGVIREDTGTVRKETTYRADKEHGYQRVEWYDSRLRYTIQGYAVDGANHGVWWTTWHDGSVLARIEYDHGRVVGAPRWWYPDGRVWARGEVNGDTITWTADVGPGRWVSELVCEADQRRRFTVWEPDRTGTVVHAVCPDGSCTEVKGAQEVLDWADPSECPPGSFMNVRVWPVLERWGQP